LTNNRTSYSSFEFFFQQAPNSKSEAVVNGLPVFAQSTILRADTKVACTSKLCEIRKKLKLFTKTSKFTEVKFTLNLWVFSNPKYYPAGEEDIQ
jgi:hypothetical protein